MSNTPQLLDTPASVPGGAQYQQLANADANDAVLNCDYAFVAYTETDSNGDWRGADVPPRQGQHGFRLGGTPVLSPFPRYRSRSRVPRVVAKISGAAEPYLRRAV